MEVYVVCVCWRWVGGKERPSFARVHHFTHMHDRRESIRSGLNCGTREIQLQVAGVRRTA